MASVPKAASTTIPEPNVGTDPASDVIGYDLLWDSECRRSLRKRSAVCPSTTDLHSYLNIPLNVLGSEVSQSTSSRSESVYETASESSLGQVNDFQLNSGNEADIPTVKYYLLNYELERVISEFATTNDLCDPIWCTKHGKRNVIVAILLLFVSLIGVFVSRKRRWLFYVSWTLSVSETLFVAISSIMYMFGAKGKATIIRFLLGTSDAEEVTNSLTFRNTFSYMLNARLEFCARHLRAQAEYDPNSSNVSLEHRQERHHERRRRAADELRSHYLLFVCPNCSQGCSSGNGNNSDHAPSVEPTSVLQPTEGHVPSPSRHTLV